MKKLPLVSIITVNYNGKHLLKECFDSLLDLNYPQDKLEIIMVDNGSVDGSIDFVKENYPTIKAIKNKENNYCQANNLGVTNAAGEYVVLLNNDVRVDNEWLTTLVNVANSDNKIGAVGSKIIFPDGKIQSTAHQEFPYYYWGDRGTLEEDKGQYDMLQQVDSVSNCAALYHKDAFVDIGMLDEDFVMYMEDVDMAFRLRQKKWKVIYVPDSIVYHKLHGSGQSLDKRKFYIERNRLLFIAKHFPDRVAEVLFGYGEILKLKYSDFHCMLLDLFKKLIKHHGSEKAKNIFSLLDYSIEKIDNFGNHCSNIETHRLISDIKQELQLKDEALNAKAEEINKRNKELHDMQMKMGILEEKLSNQAGQFNGLNEQIHICNERIDCQDVEIKKQNIRLQSQETSLAQKEQEISDIYNSETYRLFVRPIIWPTFSFIKRVTKNTTRLFGPMKVLIKKPEGKMCIAEFRASSLNAKYNYKNEYLVKVFNKSFTETSGFVVIDIWPYRNPEHPQRHYSYFGVEILLPPRDSINVRFIYDWENNVEAIANTSRTEVKTFWRGSLLDKDLYWINCLLRDREDKLMDSLNIMQKLEK